MNRMRRMYIAGPIHSPVRGLTTEAAMGRFHDLQRWLTQHQPDWLTINPLDVPAFCTRVDQVRCELMPSSDLPTGRGHTFECWMRGDIAAMMGCEGIVLLPYAFTSNGATREAKIAEMLSFDFYYASITSTGEWSITDDPDEQVHR